MVRQQTVPVVQQQTGEVSNSVIDVDMAEVVVGQVQIRAPRAQDGQRKSIVKYQHCIFKTERHAIFERVLEESDGETYKSHEAQTKLRDFVVKVVGKWNEIFGSNKHIEHFDSRCKTMPWYPLSLKH